MPLHYPARLRAGYPHPDRAHLRKRAEKINSVGEVVLKERLHCNAAFPLHGNYGRTEGTDSSGRGGRAARQTSHLHHILSMPRSYALRVLLVATGLSVAADTLGAQATRRRTIGILRMGWDADKRSGNE